MLVLLAPISAFAHYNNSFIAKKNEAAEKRISRRPFLKFASPKIFNQLDVEKTILLMRTHVWYLLFNIGISKSQACNILYAL